MTEPTAHAPNNSPRAQQQPSRSTTAHAPPPPPTRQVEARRASSGEVVYRDSLGSSVAALLRGDLRGTGAEELVAVGSQGEVRVDR